jgi:hypothetical protein
MQGSRAPIELNTWQQPGDRSVAAAERGVRPLLRTWPRLAGIALLAITAGCREHAEPSEGTQKAAASAGSGAAGKGASPSGSQAGAGGAVRASASAGRGAAGANAATTPPSLPTPDPSAYQCQPAVVDPGKSGGEGSKCCAGRGVCTAGLALSDAAGLPHDSCSAEPDLRCQPLPAADTGADADAGDTTGAVHCRVQFPGAPVGSADYEGRCVTSCFVQSSPIVSRLQQASCLAGEICSPCFNPLTGESTGACERDGDAASEPAPTAFAECGAGFGYCVPMFAAGNASAQLSQLTCDAGELCAPKNKVADPNACFERCVASLGAGACVPAFLSSAFAIFLEQSSCADNEQCAPCVLFNDRTGVCD